jgi:hypothetical protein
MSPGFAGQFDDAPGLQRTLNEHASQPHAICPSLRVAFICR